MSENNKKPDVFNLDIIKQANETSDLIQKQLREEGKLEPEMPQTSGVSLAAEEMNKKTEEQIATKNAILEQIAKMSFENEADRKKLMDQMKPTIVRPELAEGYGDKKKGEIIYDDEPKTVETVIKKEILKNVDTTTIFDDSVIDYSPLEEPQYDTLSDVIPLPSDCKLYGFKKKNLVVSFLNASDENILSNPNLIQSGRFLEILMNRKILNPNLRYRDLHTGDRDAIMIWLRSTGYGHNYPISVYDPKEKDYFETIIDLSKLKMKKLTLDPDKDGLFNFTTPISKNELKFKFLTVGDIEDANDYTQKIVEVKGAEFVDTITHVLKRQIKSVDGNSDPKFVSKFVDSMLIGDSKAFKKYVSDNESGVDMNLTVRTPGGESISTFLPINLSFFWPDVEI